MRAFAHLAVIVWLLVALVALLAAVPSLVLFSVWYAGDALLMRLAVGASAETS